MSIYQGSETVAKEPTWQLGDDNGTAVLHSGRLQLRLDLRHPESGLTDITYDALNFSGVALLQVSPEPPPPPIGETIIDAYVRGDDLVATYAQTPARSFRTQVYWSPIRPLEDVVGVDVLIALQTSLLDSQPTVFVQSCWPVSAEVMRRVEGQWELLPGDGFVPPQDESLFLIRPPETGYSYVQAVFPADFQGARCLDHEGSRLQHEFKLAFLEKGVVRKVRLQGLLVPRSNDEELAVAAFELLAQLEPHLTT